jgi:hypothetical protein
MDKFIQRLNIEHFTRLLQTISDEKERERIRKLLAEEIEKKPKGSESDLISRRTG